MTLLCCICSFSSTFHVKSFHKKSPFYCGVLDCTSFSSFLMFWCLVFLEGLMNMRKSYLFQSLFTPVIFQRQEVFLFIFTESQSLGAPMLKMYIWMSGGSILSHSAFFMCKKKKEEEKAGETEMCLPQGLLGRKNFYIRAKSHEDVHGHAHPNLSIHPANSF